MKYLLLLCLYNLLCYFFIHYKDYFLCKYYKYNKPHHYDHYVGHSYFKQGVTINKQILYETKQAAISFHSVLFENENNIINDWIYFDIIDQIIIVLINKNNQFILFNTTSYSFNGHTLSPIYGEIDYQTNNQKSNSINDINRILLKYNM